MCMPQSTSSPSASPNNHALARQWEVGKDSNASLFPSTWCHEFTDRMCIKLRGIIITDSLHTCRRSLEKFGLGGRVELKDDRLVVKAARNLQEMFMPPSGWKFWGSAQLGLGWVDTTQGLSQCWPRLHYIFFPLHSLRYFILVFLAVYGCGLTQIKMPKKRKWGLDY